MPTDDKTFTPAELARSARLHIESRFNEVRVAGELSNFRRPSSGHWYFSIKDESAQIRCAMFVNRNRFAKLQPKDGLAVLLRGRVSLYEARGDFQIIVDHMEPAGEGALRLAYEALLKQLHTEGLTDPDRKRPLPSHPARIAVITSATGAALQDMLSVWRRRYPVAEVIVLDVAVQGEQSEREVLNAIERLPTLDADLAVLTRGGGSIEDLWTFNLESVARAVAQSPIPTVSAIGHEIDVAITDYVADVRAPTPSAAAELCTPEIGELERSLSEQSRHLQRLTELSIARLRGELDRTRLRLISPGAQVQQWMQRMDDLAHRANRAILSTISVRAGQTQALARALSANHPAKQIRATQTQVSDLADRNLRALTHQLSAKQSQTQQLARTLNAVSPLNTLGRGYAIVTDPERNAVTQVGELGEKAQIHLADGYAEVSVNRVAPGEGLASNQES